MVNHHYKKGDMLVKTRICKRCNQMTCTVKNTLFTCENCKKDRRGQVGEKCPNWIDGRSVYRKKIKVEKCKNCGAKKNLHVHHIKPLKYPKKKGYGIGDQSIKNLMVLCCGCHNTFHRKGNFEPSFKKATCLYCGKKFMFRFKHNKGKFCSKKCCSTAQKGGWKNVK